MLTTWAIQVDVLGLWRITLAKPYTVRFVPFYYSSSNSSYQLFIKVDYVIIHVVNEYGQDAVSALIPIVGKVHTLRASSTWPSIVYSLN